MRYEEPGMNITVPLKKYGYADYKAKCLYSYNKQDDNYTLSMFLKRDDLGDLFEVDEQIFHSTREMVRENICKIVERAAQVKYFDKYISRIEYYCKCFDVGNEVLSCQN